MPDLGMRGPYRLNRSVVDREVANAYPGNFAVGYLKESGAFVVRYVGRADSDLHQTLSEQETDESTWFKWTYTDSSHSAFDTECRNYHDFGGNAQLENEYHPEPPRGSKWRCPVCRQ